MKNLVENKTTLTPSEFFELRRSKENRGLLNFYNIPGVYILYNKTLDKYYVGQGKKVMERINHHFVGRGNGDVYADYKYGSLFDISFILLRNTDYTSLNELERVTIKSFNAYSKGYNKTRGNR